MSQPDEIDKKHLVGKIQMMMTRAQHRRRGRSTGPGEYHPVRANADRGYRIKGAGAPQVYERVRKGQVIVPIEESFFAERFGMLRD